MKVRALPTCRKPVGDGANRTRSITFEYSGSRARALGVPLPDSAVICLFTTETRSHGETQLLGKPFLCWFSEVQRSSPCLCDSVVKKLNLGQYPLPLLRETRQAASLRRITLVTAGYQGNSLREDRYSGAHLIRKIVLKSPGPRVEPAGRHLLSSIRRV